MEKCEWVCEVGCLILQEDIEVGEVRIKHKKTEDEKQRLIDKIEDKK